MPSLLSIERREFGLGRPPILVVDTMAIILAEKKVSR